MEIFPGLFFHYCQSRLLQELVDELYNFRDCYFENHSMEDAKKKDSDVTQEMEKTLKYLQEKEGEWSSCTIFLLAEQIQVCPISHRSV